MRICLLLLCALECAAFSRTNGMPCSGTVARSDTAPDAKHLPGSDGLEIPIIVHG